MLEPIKRARGRPRRHETPSARGEASRVERGIKKVTVDVPEKFAGHIRTSAAHLRSLNADQAVRELAIKPFVWIYDNEANCYVCTYNLTFKEEQSGQVIKVHCWATIFVILKTDNPIDEIKVHKWVVNRVVVDRMSRSTLVEDGIASGVCDTYDLAKELCQAIILVSVRFAKFL